MKEMMSVDYVAELTGIGRDVLGRLIKAGDLIAIDVSEKRARRPRWRIRRGDLERFLAARRTTSAPTNSPPLSRTGNVPNFV